MLTHYIDFDVIDGATQADAALLHGRILSAIHFAGLGSFAFDFPEWRSEGVGGKVLRLFGSSEMLEKLLDVLAPLTRPGGAVTHSPVSKVPFDAKPSDYVYSRARGNKAYSSSYMRRFQRRNPNANWVQKERGKPRHLGYRIPMLSKSNKQTYPLYVVRDFNGCASDATNNGNSNGLRINVPVFNNKNKTVVSHSHRTITADNNAAHSDDGLIALNETDSIMLNIETVFGENGLLVRDGGNHNPAQLKYAITAAKTLMSERSDDAPPIGMLEGSTGTGKTLGYLIPALLCAQKTNARVVVSTFTKQLQEQLAHEDAIKAARYIKELTGRTIKVDRRYGRGNYLSLTACKAFLTFSERNEGSADLHDFIAKILAWGQKKKNTLVVLNDYLDEHDLSVEDIPAGFDYSVLSIGELSTPAEVEAYEETVKLTNESDLLIVNHALSVINARSWMSILESGDRKNIYIFDEADKLDDAAHSVASKYISIRKAVNLLLEGVNSYSKKGAGQSTALAGAMSKSIEKALGNGRQMNAEVITDVKEFLKSANGSVLKAARSIVSKEQGIKEQLKKADFIDSYNNLAQAISLIERGSSYSLTASPVQGFPRLLVGQSSPARVLSRLWSSYRRTDKDGQGAGEVEKGIVSAAGVLLTSATLASRAGSFMLIASTSGVNTGINKATGEPYHNAVTELWMVIEAENFGSMHFVLPDQRIPHPTLKSNERNEDDEETVLMSEKWLSYTADMIHAAQAKGGRTLVLTTSFKASRELNRAVEKRDAKNLFCHSRGEKLNQHLSSFTNNKDSILITHGAWEGLNLPGLIQNIVIPRIPYSPPSGERSRLREMSLEDSGLSASRTKGIALSESIDSAVRKLKQGVGRGIRAKNDEVTVWLSDPRFPLPTAYGSSFDSILMKFPRKQRRDLLGFVPKRFLPSYNAAPLFINGKLYQVKV